MPYYIVNTNAEYGSDDHEVHVLPQSDCSSPTYPRLEYQERLGFYDMCFEAVAEARRRGYISANGCYYCSRLCNIR